MGFQVRVSAGLQRLFDGVPESVLANGLNAAAIETRELIADRTPVSTGDTARRWQIDLATAGNLTANVYNDSIVAVYLEYGTPPHVIKPKNKKALYWAGARHPVKSVNHPGTRPRFIVRNSMPKVKEILSENILRAIRGYQRGQ